MGQSKILIESYTKGSNIAFDHTLDIISEISISQLNSHWEKFYTQDNGTTNYNYIATIEVSEIIPGVEREKYNTYTATKRVKEGKQIVKDRSGRIFRDTSGNVIYEDKFIDVTAEIEELTREKFAHMSGRVVIIDALDNTLINAVPINVTHKFRDYSFNYIGDKRAIPTNKTIKSRCDLFPSDYEITTNMAYAYKEAAEESIDKQYF